MKGRQFNRNDQCPNCNSGNHVRKGNDESCWGIPYEKGFICTREELAGKAKRVDTGYWHWFENCKCDNGTPHSNNKSRVGYISDVKVTHKHRTPDEIRRKKHDDKANTLKTLKAQWLWEEGKPVLETNADKYLAESRGLTIHRRSKEVLQQLRYHPSINHYPTFVEDHLDNKPKKFSALLCKVTDKNDDFQAIQRIYLEGNQKAEIEPNKMSFGAIKGGAVKLGQPTESGCLGIAEGVETALTIMECIDIPTWACLGTGNMHQIPLPPLSKIHTVKIYADGDDAGTQAMERAGDLWINQGYEVKTCKAPTDSDYNTILQTHLNTF